ncbi:amidase [Nakamurella deserti]|uniref:amidase n=1 Tax=Nakamurella deserti TaxID=2164074 RepID=UPI000DBE209A|nr:amidase [Nakamurella deserti]
MTRIHDLTAIELAAGIATGELSSSDVVGHYLDRIARHDAGLGAFRTVTPDLALAAARRADAAVAARRGRGPELPALHGVPLAVKDLTATAGVRTTFGSALYADLVPDVSDDVVAHLETAGTISLGKTNAPEFGLPCYTENRLGPPARTPHDPGRMAGGSSGGAAAAVAGGLLPFAHGTDGGGSLRIPAAMCGLVGLKTTRGLVSRGPVGSDALGLSVHGPLARTAADAAALLEAMQTPVWSEPYVSPRQSGLVAAAGRDPGRLRIGRSLDTAIAAVADVVVDPEVRAAWEDTSALLAELGHEVVDLDIPDPPGLVPAFLTVWAAFTHARPLPPEAVDLLMPLTRHLWERGAGVGGPELVQAMGTVQAAGRTLARAMGGCDAVLFPTVARLPPPVGWFTDPCDPAEDFRRQLVFTPWTAQINITGQPAVSVPLQWTADGLPVGMQFVGRHGAEALLLSLTGQLERARPWRHHLPGMW